LDSKSETAKTQLTESNYREKQKRQQEKEGRQHGICYRQRMNATIHIFVSWCSVVEIQIVAVNKMLESKIQQTLEKRRKK